MGNAMDPNPPAASNSFVLLTREQEELNTWVRTTLQIYFSWYCVFLSVNGAALVWIFKDNNGPGKGVAERVGSPSNPRVARKGAKANIRVATSILSCNFNL
jgi:hypothetical protein